MLTLSRDSAQNSINNIVPSQTFNSSQFSLSTPKKSIFTP